MNRRQSAEELADIAIKAGACVADGVSRECLISDFDTWLRDYEPEWEPWDGY